MLGPFDWSRVEGFQGHESNEVARRTLFTLLWLCDIIPDLMAAPGVRRRKPVNVPTNPVHVLDLALFLPATAAS